MERSSAAVSVVIPCYNGAAFLADALSSVHQQQLVAEIVVVDDGCTDDSVIIARRFGARVVTTTGRTGPANARNVGVAATSAPLVAFLDADDYWLPGHVATVVEAMERHGAALAGGSRIEADEPLPSMCVSSVEGSARPIVFDDLLRSNPFKQSAVILQRWAFEKSEGYRIAFRHAEDYDLWLRMSLLPVTMIMCDSATCVRRKHDQQASLALSSMKRGAWNARADSLERLHDWSRAQGVVHNGARITRCHDALGIALREDARDVWYVADSAARAVLEEFVTRLPFLKPAWRKHLTELGPWWLATAKRHLRELRDR